VSRRQLRGTELKRLHRSWGRRTERTLWLLLDSVQTPWNVGAIVRTAAAYKVDELLLVGPAAATPSHPRSRKTSLGTERYVHWTSFDEPGAAVASAHDADLQVLGIELVEGAAALPDLELDGNVCLALGHEDHGLSNATLALCDHVAYIPQPGKVGSLNVASAAAIALYEMRRREWST
jgi:tRNA (guanosine-2'-O-)-methyltransferase